MARTKYIQHNFTAGEISKKAEGRVDFGKYYNAVKTLRNFLPTILGGADRRPGFHFADYPKYQNKKHRLVPFRYGVTQAYSIEVGDLYMRFWMDGYLIRELTGSDLVTNGGFPADMAGWTDYSVAPGTATWNAGGWVDLNGGATGIGSIGQALTTVTGKTYCLTFDVGTNPLYLRIGTTAQGTEIVYDIKYNTGTLKQACFIARGATTYIQFLRKSNGIATLDNVACKEYAPIEIESPYLEADLPLLKWAQSANYIFFAHPNYQVHLLANESNTLWHLEKQYFEDGPYFNQVTLPTITPNWAGPSVNTVVNGDFLVDANWVKGANWTISGGKAHKSAGGPNNLSQDTGEAAWPYLVTYTIDSISGGNLTVWIGGVSGTPRSTPGTYREVIVATGTGDLTFVPDAATICTIDNVFVHGLATLTASGPLFQAGHLEASWRLGWETGWGWVRLEKINSATSAYAYVGTAIGTTATAYHREGRWSDVRGYPRSVTFHENRLCFGGAITSPQTFWESKTEEELEMTPGTTDADAVQFTLGSAEVNLIQWIISAGKLIIGTAGGEFKASGGGNSPITPTNIDVKNDTTYGCADVMPLRVGNAIIFLQGAGRQVLELLYNYDEDSYEADDLTVLADHLTEKGIIEMVYQKGYNPVIWCYDTEGTLLALTYNKKQQVVGWSHHISGIVESLCVIPNPIERTDEVYASVLRTLNGIPTRCIEYLDPYLNVDCGLAASFAEEVSVISGLEHLAGVEVRIVGDDAVYPPQTVNSNGQLTLSPKVLNAEIGLGYTSYLETLRPEIQSEQQTIQACKMRWTKIIVRLYETIGLKINGEEIPFRTSLNKMDEGITPYTGDKPMLNLGWEDAGKIIIEQDKPLPAHILCIFGNLEVNED